MDSLSRITKFALTAIAVAAAGSASATTLLSFGIRGIGTFTVNTGSITAATASKTLPASELLGGSTTPTAFTQAGLATGGSAIFSLLTLPTLAGAIAPFTVSAGTLGFVATFTNITSV